MDHPVEYSLVSLVGEEQRRPPPVPQLVVPQEGHPVVRGQEVPRPQLQTVRLDQTPPLR